MAIVVVTTLRMQMGGNAVKKGRSDSKCQDGLFGQRSYEELLFNAKRYS